MVLKNKTLLLIFIYHCKLNRNNNKIQYLRVSASLLQPPTMHHACRAVDGGVYVWSMLTSYSDPPPKKRRRTVIDQYAKQ